MLLYYQKPTGCLNLVISLSAMASNRLGQTLGLWFVDTTRFISIVVKVYRQTDGRAMLSQAHTAPTTFRIRSRGFFLHGESKFIVYGIQSSDVGLSKVGEEKKKCVCVCPVSAAVSWSLRRVVCTRYVFIVCRASRQQL